MSNTGSKAANSASKASSKASALTPALRSADSAACTEAACATSLGSTKLMPMPITATLRPPLRTVSIKMPPNLSAPITKSFGHLICACTPQLVQSLPAGKRRHQCQRAQFVLRPLKSPAQAEHQAFAQAVLPAFALPPAAAALLVRHHQRTVGGLRRLLGLFQHAIVAGGASSFNKAV